MAADLHAPTHHYYIDDSGGIGDIELFPDEWNNSNWNDGAPGFLSEETIKQVEDVFGGGGKLAKGDWRRIASVIGKINDKLLTVA
jgi:hypothetical protein